MMHTFQNEWDALMLETFTLKQHLEATRQELAHALYQHDAACRVIARLIKERDEARAALGDVQKNAAAGSADNKNKEGIPTEGIKTITNTAKVLAKARKKRIKAVAAEVTRKETLKKYVVKSSHSLHSASKPGVLSLDIHTDQQQVITGGADGNAIVFSRKTGKIVDTLKGHKKRINSSIFHPTEKLAFTTSADGTAVIWGEEDGKYTSKHVLSDHTADVTGCTLHPSGQYMVTASLDKSWCFYDIPTGTCYKKLVDEKITAGYTKCAFHPDGIMLGTGTEDSIVRVFEITAQKNVANIQGHTGKVTAVAFSENGYFLASGDEQGVVKLWDLRKLENFHTITPAKAEGGIGSLSFDASGSYLSVGGDTLGIYSTKGWELVKTWGDHSGLVTSVCMGDKAEFFATTSKDRTLKFYEA